MAYKNKIISNPVTGQEIKFICTGKESKGQLLEMEAVYSPHSKEPVPHYHPYQKEDFTIISGEMIVRIDDKLLILKQGDTLHIPANKVHSMWNNSDQKTILNWKVQPAMNTDNFLETVTGLAIDGKTNSSGIPDILHTAVLASKFSKVFRLAKPPYLIQKILFTILKPFSNLTGRVPAYKKYFD